jgi:hypothetical protein
MKGKSVNFHYDLSIILSSMGLNLTIASRSACETRICLSD